MSVPHTPSQQASRAADAYKPLTVANEKSIHSYAEGLENQKRTQATHQKTTTWNRGEAFLDLVLGNTQSPKEKDCEVGDNGHELDTVDREEAPKDEEPTEPSIAVVTTPVKPLLSPSEEASVKSVRAQNHSVGLMTMETMGATLRSTMRVYRTGKPFLFGAASLDNISTSEMLASTDPSSQMPVINRAIGSWHTFAQVHGMKAKRNKTATMAGSSLSGHGLSAGGFYQLNPELSAGIMLSTNKSAMSYTGGLGAGSVESVSIGPIMSWFHNDLHVDAALGLVSNHYSNRRQDDAGNAISSRSKGRGFSAYANMGYDLHMGHWLEGLTLTPLAEVMYFRIKNGRYGEDASSDEALQVNGSSSYQVISRLGFEASYLLPDLEKPIEVKVRLGGQHQKLNGQTSNYVIHGVENVMNLPSFSENSVFMGLGLQRKIGDMSYLSLNYDGNFSPSGRSHGLQLQLEKQF